jgi:cytochrome P450
MTSLNQNRARPLTPPRAYRIPVLGPIVGLATQPLHFLEQARERYGDIYTLDFGVTKVTMLNSPHHIQHVLVDRAANYRKGGQLWDSIRALLGNGLPVSEGDFWLRQRRMMQPHFHRQRLAGLTAHLVAATSESLQHWDAAVGRPFNLAGAFSPITMRVITRMLFGQGLARKEIDDVSGAMAYMLDYITLGSLARGLPSWVPVPGAARFARCRARVDEVISRLIERQRAAAHADDTLLAMLVAMVDDETGAKMDNVQLRDEVVSMFLAGYETTSVTLAWLFYYLAQHPQVAERIRAEVDEVLGEREPSFADLPQLAYTRMAVMEALRVRPPVWWLTRTAVEDDTIDGLTIPAGSLVGTVFYAAHHHPDYWEHPERFEPERFTPERAAGRHKYAWAPFGAGQRHCIGKDLAMMEAQVIVAMIFQRFNVEHLPTTARPVASSTLRTGGAINVLLQRRGAR